jgi:hypothetical protein
MLPALRRFHRQLGIDWGQVIMLDQLAYHYRERGHPPSISQAVIADELGLTRPTVNGHLKKLSRSGLIATREDPWHGRITATLHYCLEPCYAAVSILASRMGGPSSEALLREAFDRFNAFLKDTEAGRWRWSVDGVTTPPAPWNSVATLFTARYGLGGRVRATTSGPASGTDGRSDTPTSGETTHVEGL